MKRFLLFVVIISHVTLLLSQTVLPELKWELAYSKNLTSLPSKFIPATVPGAVQLDVAKAEKYGPYYYAENWKDYGWMEDQYYIYKTTFTKPELKSGQRLVFISKGIDYQFQIFLNDEKLLEQEGMFTWVKLDLTDKIKPKNELRIIVNPVPKKASFPVDRSQAAHVTKPAVSYTWDWHPRLVPLGIWDDTYLEIQSAAFVNDVKLNYELSKAFDAAKIKLNISGRNLQSVNYSWKLKDASGKEVLQSSGKFNSNEQVIDKELSKPELWWPHDHGAPYLYTSVLEISDNSGLIQTVSRKIGFRRVQLVMNEGSWNEPAGFPKTRSNPPAQFVVNGRKIFAKGTNWVNPEIFPGVITRERYNKLLDQAVEVNLNILRVWGGGIVNKESFFDLCDEKGILVWQEFPLACNHYPDDPHYLQILEQEATSIINRLREHPSLALWSGGNELFNSWSGMDDQSLPLRLLNSLTLRFTPEIPFIPTSPLMGMGHGNYVFRDPFTKEEVIANMNRSHFTAYTEFGMPSPSSVEILKKIIPEKELWPPKPGTSWESHHAFNAWVGNTWLCEDILNDYFGPAQNLEELVKNGQLLQCEGYKAIFEEARRQKPYCAMALNWCYNEPWPTAANNSIINYPDIPKPAFYAVSNSCRPVCASARLRKFQWREGEEFTADIWLLNDLPKAIDGGTIVVKLVSGSYSTELLKWDFNQTQPNLNMAGPTVRCKIPLLEENTFKLVLECVGHPEYNSEYTMVLRQSAKKVKGTAIMNQ